MPQPFNILVSSAGRRVSLVRHFQTALAELGIRGQVWAADLTTLSSAWHAADRGAPAPRFATGRFIDEMLQLCKREKIQLLVPTIDTELPLYSEAKAQFAEIGTTIAISSPEAINICEDKRQTHQWLSELGLPVPRQASIEAVLNDPEAWSLPLITKPARGSSSVNMKRIQDLKQLANIPYPEVMVVESLASGDEYTIDVYIDKTGKPRCAVPRMRLETRSGEVSKGMTIREPKLQQLAEQVAAALPGGFGCINVQIFFDREQDTAQIIEINPRFGGGYPLSHQAGAVCTHWLVEDCLDLPLWIEPDAWRDGVVMLRYDEAVFIDKSDIYTV